MRRSREQIMQTVSQHGLAKSKIHVAQVPTLVLPDGSVLTETLAIAEYAVASCCS